MRSRPRLRDGDRRHDGTDVGIDDDGQGPGRLCGAGVPGGIGGQVRWSALGVRLLVEPGQLQQIVDHSTHSFRHGLGTPHGHGQIIGAHVGAPAEQLGVAANRRERGTQLVLTFTWHDHFATSITKVKLPEAPAPLSRV